MEEAQEKVQSKAQSDGGKSCEYADECANERANECASGCASECANEKVPGNAGEIVVRAGRKEDQAQVAELTRSTFSWGDYVADAFLEWIEGSPNKGQVFVAVTTHQNAGKIVGVTHVRYLSPDEAWFEGIRVHPDFRRLGIGQKLTEASIEAARLRGCKVCRAAIDPDNEKSSGLAAKFGFRKAAKDVAEYILDVPLKEPQEDNWESRRGPDPFSQGITVAQASADRHEDIAAATALAKKSLTFIGCDYVWRSVTESNMSSLAEEGLLWLAYKNGAVIAGATSGDFWVVDDQNGSELNWQMGSPFGDIQGINAIFCAIAKRAKDETLKRGLNSLKLCVAAEKGSLVPVPPGLHKDELEFGIDLWELELTR